MHDIWLSLGPLVHALGVDVALGWMDGAAEVAVFLPDATLLSQAQIES